FRDDRLQKKGGGRGTGQLRQPIEESFDRADALGDPDADGHSRIEVPTGNVAESGNHDGEGQAVGERDAKETESTARAMQVLIRANRAGAKKDQGEGTD